MNDDGLLLISAPKHYAERLVQGHLNCCFTTYFAQYLIYSGFELKEGKYLSCDGIENAATYETKLSSETSTGSGKSVELKSTSVTVPGYGILHGPYLASQKSVKLQVGDKIEFDWRVS